MTSEKIQLLDDLENLEREGYIVDARWSFCGYKCIIWELHNDHDIDIEIKSKNSLGFKTKWEAYEAALKYLNKNE